MNKNKIIVIAIITVIVLFPFIFLTESKCGIFDRDYSISLVSYFGAIFGGSITLVGVIWTIKFSERPILYFDRCEIKDINDKDCFMIDIYIENVGKGVAYINNIYCECDLITPSESDMSVNIPALKEEKFTFICELDKSTFENVNINFTVTFDSYYKCGDKYYFTISNERIKT